MSDRVKRLQEMLERNPHQAFPRYGLAMEYRRLGEVQAALEEFRRLLAEHPDYVPAYLHCGMTLVEAGESAEAAQVFRQGIAAAREQGDNHAAEELQGALTQLTGQ